MDRPQGPSNKHIVFLFTGFMVLFILVFALGVIVGKGLSDSRVASADNEKQNSISGIQKNDEPEQADQQMKGNNQEEMQNILDDVKSQQVAETGEESAKGNVENPPDELIREEDQEEGKNIELSPEAKISLKVEKAEVGTKPVSKPSTSVPVSMPKIDPNGQYTVQIASFKNESQATSLQNKLKSAGYPAFIKQASVGQETWFRLRVGTFADKDQAKAYADMLLKKEPDTVQSVYVTPNL